MLYQHGDVLLHQDSIPEGVQILKTDILASGEHTNHHHRLHEGDYTVYEEPKTKVKYLRVVEPATLRHEEHHARVIPPGTYRIGIVREYSHWDEEARQVAD